MDKLGADFEMTLQDIRDKFGVTPAVMVYPMGAETSFRGVIQLLEKKALFWKDSSADTEPEIREIPEEYQAIVEKKRAELVEVIAETDDVLMEKYLMEQEISVNELKAALRQATIDYKLVPIFCGSSFKNTGLQVLLDGVIDYLPSPQDIDQITGKNPDTNEDEIRHLVPEERFCGLAFKIQTDPHVGTLTYVRVYSGVLQSGSYVYNSSTKTKERVGRLLLMHSNEREEIAEARSGEIVAIIGLKNTSTGDTLCDEEHQIILERIIFSEPVIYLSIEPKTKDDQEKMSVALNKLSSEDPTFAIKVDGDTGQTLIGGMGELHLEILVDRMRREFNVNVSTGKPQVAYRETIMETSQGEGKYIKQSGGRGQYGHVLLKIEPMERGLGYEFVNEIKGATIPKEFIPPVDKGIQESMERGHLADYPMTDMKVTLYDGSYHEVDSSEIAFKMAGSMGLRDALSKNKVVLIEPIMNVEVTTPEEFMGDIIGDLGSRRAQIKGTKTRGTAVIITGLVPLAEMQGYVTVLRSQTQGRATSVMLPSHYGIVPTQITNQIIAERKGPEKK